MTAHELTDDSHGREIGSRESKVALRCAGCNHEFEVGDRYIEDDVSGFLKLDAEPEIDGLIAGIFGGAGGKVRYCADCTEDGGDYLFETFYGDEVAS